MSGLHRSKIEWCDSTFNPVTGCLHGCPYCYAKINTNRFQPKASEWPDASAIRAAQHDPRCYIAEKATALYDADGKYIRSTPYPKGFSPTFHTYKLQYPKDAKAPRMIFVGSMCDLFGDWIPDEWIKAVFKACKEAPQHVYMFLTKNPARYTYLAMSDRLPSDDNYWYGTTVTTADEPYWFATSHRTFVSIEPILSEFERSPRTLNPPPDWVIVGAMTGPNANKHRPHREWVEAIIGRCADRCVPVFMKNSLAGIWGGPLVREWPEVMLKHVGRNA
jgi:protein gp37